jgi:MYXO-CTERM domain-containing protein
MTVSGGQPSSGGTSNSGAPNGGSDAITGGTGGQPGTETCNCRVPSESSGSGRGAVGLLALGAAALFRRRRAHKIGH